MKKSAKYHSKNVCFDNASSLKKIERVFDFEASGIKILDLGCGDGKLSSELVKMGYDVWGADIFFDGVEKAKKNGIKAIVADIEEKLPFKDSSFDTVLVLDTLEHLYDAEGALGEAYRVLKDDGNIIISFPNHFDVRNRLNMLLGKGIIHWSCEKRCDIQAWSYGHVRFLLYRELKELLEASSFYPKKTQFNFMAGGLIPRRLTPSYLRFLMLRMFPQLFSGKYVVLAGKKPEGTEEKYYIAETVEGM